MAEISDIASAGLPVTPLDESSITRETFFEAHQQSILGIGFIVGVLLAWELIPVFFELSKATQLFFTTPSAIFVQLFELIVLSRADPVLGTLWVHLYASSVAFGVGLALSIIVALPLGVVLGRFQTMDAMFDPFITAFNATPRLVFLPLVLIWFGVGMNSVIVIVFIGAVFPLLINTYAGVKNADRLLINVVKSFGANEWQVNKMVVLPNSLPFIIAGLRLAIGRAILGVVVAEFFGGAENGLGKLMVHGAQSYAVDLLFAIMLIFMTISLFMTAIVKKLENRLSLWRPERVKTF